MSVRYQRSIQLAHGLCLVGIAVLAGVDCMSVGRPIEEEEGSGEGGSGNAGTGSGNNEAGGLGFGGGPPSGPGCSADLRSVVDANGNVIQECPVDRGCSGGVCVPACQAAADSKGSVGCDFWAPDPPSMGNGGASFWDGPCYAVFLANTWGRSAKVTVTRGGQMLDVAQFARVPVGVAPSTTYDPLPPQGVPPNGVAILFLAHKPGVKSATGASLECPVQPAVLADTAIVGTGKGQAFRVAIDTPVAAYDILPYGGAESYYPSATLLYPSTAWGTNYYAVAPHSDWDSLWALVVAREDNTVVKVAAATSLPGGNGVAPAPQGQTTTYTINAGESLQWLDSASRAYDPTGAVFESDKPIGLWTGSLGLSVSTVTSPAGGGSDSAHQQLAHVKALGNEYVGAGVVTRLLGDSPESVPYRLLGVTDGTQLTWDPAPPAGAPSTLAAGQVAEFETTLAFSVRSQDEAHPFAFTQYMPGAPSSSTSRQDCTPGLSVTCGLGDEEWITLVPPKQFLQRYVFFTDPTYATTNLVVIRVKGGDGFADVNIPCLGGAVSGWKPIGNGGRYEYAHVDLVRGTVPVASCNTSRHEATSKGSFGVIVWGTDLYGSYGYPAGGSIGAINDVVVLPEPK